MPRHLLGKYAACSERASPDGEAVVGTEYLNVGDHVVQFYGHDEELAERVVPHSFSLFCGYPAASVTGDGHLDAFAAVCRLHREVVGLSPAGASGLGGPADGHSAVRTYPFSRDAPAVARHFTVGTLHDWGAGDIAGDAALVVTELAANAIVHAHSAFTIVLSAHGDLVRIAGTRREPAAWRTGRGAGARPAARPGRGRRPGQPLGRSVARHRGQDRVGRTAQVTTLPPGYEPRRTG